MSKWLKRKGAKVEGQVAMVCYSCGLDFLTRNVYPFGRRGSAIVGYRCFPIFEDALCEPKTLGELYEADAENDFDWDEGVEWDEEEDIICVSCGHKVESEVVEAVLHERAGLGELPDLTQADQGVDVADFEDLGELEVPE